MICGYMSSVMPMSLAVPRLIPANEAKPAMLPMLFLESEVSGVMSMDVVYSLGMENDIITPAMNPYIEYLIINLRLDHSLRPSSSRSISCSLLFGYIFSLSIL